MEWAENEELTNDRCSTASSISNSGDVNGSISAQSNGSKAMNNLNLNGTQNTQTNSNTSLNLDSMSDGELSDFSLSDDDEFRSASSTGKIRFFFFFGQMNYVFFFFLLLNSVPLLLFLH